MDRPKRTTADYAQRRRLTRTPVRLLVEYDGLDDLITDFTEDLSVGGTFIRTTRALAIGAVIRLDLSFPGLLEPIALDSVVRWTREETEAEDAGVGVEFLNLDERGRKRIEELLAALEHGDPAYVARLVRVLVIEDNPHVANLIRDGLQGRASRIATNMAFNFRLCSDGAEAVSALETERFDVAIVDVYLPILDGSEVIRRIRAREETAGMPVLALSAGGSNAEKSALEAGATAFVAKPMRLHTVIETMRTLLQDLGPAR